VSLYADASVLVPFFTEDVFSRRVDNFFDASRPIIILSDFASAEFASVVARKVRTRELTDEQARAVFAVFDRWASEQAARVQVSSADVVAAEVFIRRLDLNLRAPDAINIAIAARLGAELATFDDRMAGAARALGCAVAEI